MKSVLFVCLGNICRSPAAEGVFRKLAADAGREAEFEVDSAGTSAWHAGSLPDERMRRAAARRGYALESRARQFEPADLDRFDLILTMDEQNFHRVSALGPSARARIARLTEYCIIHGISEVPDPYFGSEDGFESVLDILEDACAELLRRL